MEPVEEELYVSEFDDADEILGDDDLNDEEPVEETAGEYAEAEPPYVEMPPDDEDQNPGAVEYIDHIDLVEVSIEPDGLGEIIEVVEVEEDEL